MEKKNKLIKSLSRGLSGCKLSISADGKFVTKTSSDLNYNHRMLNQIKKQSEFNSMKIERMKCPAIIERAKNEEGLEYFTMEYVKGKDYLDFLNYSSPEEIDIFIESILKYLEFLRSDEIKCTDLQFSEMCKSKLNSIEKDIPHKEFLNFIENKISSLKNIDVPMSFCHGDLTLSNILFSNKNVFLLDFLDSYIESWVIDLVKLKQDLFYFWSFLKDEEELNLRCVQSSLKIWKSIEKKYKKTVNSEEFKVLEALNFLRIYPYAKRNHEKSTIEKILKKLPIYEEFNNPDGR